MPSHHDAPLSFWNSETQKNPFFHKLLMVVVFNHSNREVVGVTCSDRPHHCQTGCSEAAQLGWLGSRLAAGKVRCFSLLIQDKTPWMTLLTTLRKPTGLQFQYLGGWVRRTAQVWEDWDNILTNFTSHPKKTDVIFKKVSKKQTRSTAFRLVQIASSKTASQPEHG